MRKHLLLPIVLLPAACNLPWNTSARTNPPAAAPERSQTPRLTAAESPEPLDPEPAAARQQVEAYVDTFAGSSEPSNTGSSAPPSADHANAPPSSPRDVAAAPSGIRRPAASAHSVDADQAATPADRPSAGGAAPFTAQTNAQPRIATPANDSDVGTIASPRASSSAPTAPQTAAAIERPGDAQTPDTPTPAPPRLISAAVAPAPAARNAAESTSSASPNRPARPGAAQSIADRIAELERTVAENPNDLEAQFRLRLLQLADGRDAQAAAPTPGMTHELEETVLAAVGVVSAARTGAGRDPAQWANRQIEAIEAYAALVRRQADLLVTRVALCSEALSYGVYEEIDPPRFPAGRQTTVLVYIEVANLRDEPTADDRRRTRLSVRLSLLDRAGQEVWSHIEENLEDVCRNARRDYFVAIDLNIPTSLNPGRYTLKATVTDAIGLRTNEGRTEFELFAP